MGWLYMRSLGPHPGPRQYLDAQFTFERPEARCRVLRSALLRLRTYYAAVERIGADGERRVSALVCLVRYNPNDREGYAFGYKDMDECDVRSLSSAYADLNVDLQRLGREVLRRRIARHLAPEDRGRFAPEVEEAERQAA